jgi:hypothetical protein
MSKADTILAKLLNHGYTYGLDHTLQHAIIGSVIRNRIL